MKSNLALALLVCVALAGCSIARESERSIITSGYDFTPYTAKGFFISPEQYLLPYESIGMIKVSFYPEVKRLASVTSFDRGKYDETTGVRTWLIEKIDVRAVIDAAYKQAFNMGADAR